ncbi:hypothetical protein QBC35DRAFT_7066 [Podospora australis]|uniref:Hikeshi-like domain-containing protein n=1 Tax=Podospora australis TaxID=1536484 RepID=A0AAN7AQC9_9PEZI|nr:hypothetical protein QBC35DRAFT_7066 [Podospora australis]
MAQQPQQHAFGLVLAGQAVITAPTQTLSPTSFLYALPPSPEGKAVSHIVVFLLPGIVLPPGTAAAIYLVTPNTTTQTPPKFLGAIGAGKESAIFKITAPLQGVGIGISVEPEAAVATQMTSNSNALVPVSKTPQPSTLVLAQRIIGNAFNFLSSFSSNDMVPLSAFTDWWKKFESKVRTDPTFLERDI